MRTRKLGQWLGRLVAVIALAAGATAGAFSAVTADEVSGQGPAVSAQTNEAGESPDDYAWD